MKLCGPADADLITLSNTKITPIRPSLHGRLGAVAGQPDTTQFQLMAGSMRPKQLFFQAGCPTVSVLGAESAMICADAGLTVTSAPLNGMPRNHARRFRIGQWSGKILALLQPSNRSRWPPVTLTVGTNGI